MAFEKGHPGGPGRPPGSKNKDGASICREWADKFGFDFLKRVAQGDELFEEKRINSKGKESVTKRTPYITERLNVAQYLVDRAYGKATAAVSLDVNAKITLEHLLLTSSAGPTILTGEIAPEQLPPPQA